MSDKYCPVCKCDPCDCGWGNDCGTEEGDIDRVYITAESWWNVDGDDLGPPILSSWEYYDESLEHIERLYGSGGPSQSYLGTVVLSFKVGDPVKYFPNCNLSTDAGIWIVKDIINKHSLDCSWYDYEITNGTSTTMCREQELFKLEQTWTEDK